MGSQGAAIDFPNEDEIEERQFPGLPGRYGMLPYGQEYLAAPSAPATMGPYYAAPTTAAPYAAPPVSPLSYARPPNPAAYQPAPASYQPAASAPVYPSVNSPSAPMATAPNSYNNYPSSAAQYSTTTAAPYAAQSTSSTYPRPSNQAAYQAGPLLPPTVSYVAPSTTRAPAPYQAVSVSAPSAPMVIVPNSYNNY